MSGHNAGTVDLIGSSAHTTRAVSRWPNRIEDIANRFATSRVAVFVAFTVLYLIPTLKLTYSKFLWDDEFFTLYLSSASGWGSLLEGLRTGADQHPPPFYWLTQGIVNTFGFSHLTVRLPAIIGFLVMSICLYEIVRRFAPPIWGVVAMLIPLSTKCYYYATEARGYGLVLGFSALAVLAWTVAASGERRALLLPVLGASLAAAVSSHYYAGLILMPLATGELVRTALRKKMDWPVWIAFSSVVLPIIAFLPIIQSAHGYSDHFWAKARLSTALEVLPTMFGFFPNLLVAALAIVIGCRFTGRIAGVPRHAPGMRAWEAAVFIVLCALPLVGMAFGKIVTHGMTPRYVIPTLIGMTVVITATLGQIARYRTLVATLLVACCLGFLVCNAYIELLRFRRIGREISMETELLGNLKGNPPIVISEMTIFHRLSFYASRDLASRLVYVADPALSVRYLGHDTVDRGFLDLRPWFPLNIVPFHSFLNTNGAFFEYGYNGDWSWLTSELVKMHADIRIIDRAGDRLLCLVRNATADTKIDQYTPNKFMLYSKVPRTGPSLYDLYLSGRVPRR